MTKTITRPEPVASGPRELREIIGKRKERIAKKDQHLLITPDIIRRSIPRSQCHCVMATAARASVADPNLVDVAVRLSRAWLVYGPDDGTGWYERYELPKSTADQVKQYDLHGVWVPGLYRLKKMRPAALGKPSRKGTSRKGISMPPSQSKNRKRTAIPLSGFMLKRNDPSFYTGTTA